MFFVFFSHGFSGVFNLSDILYNVKSPRIYRDKVVKEIELSWCFFFFFFSARFLLREDIGASFSVEGPIFHFHDYGRKFT